MAAVPLKVFIIYSRADTTFKDDLRKQLSPLVKNGTIQDFADSDLLPGEEWEGRLKDELDRAHLIFMLVSSDALDSDFIEKRELKTALAKKDAGTARVIPILIRDCIWELHPELSKLQLLPKDEQGKIRGVAAWPSQDSAWAHCLRELIKVIEEIKQAIAKEAADIEAENARTVHKQAEEAKKAENTRHKRDEATWKKIIAELETSTDHDHKITLLEAYIQDDNHRNHRGEAEELLADIRADIDATQKLEAAKVAAVRKKQEAAEKARIAAAEQAEKERKEKEAADQKRKAKMALILAMTEMVHVEGGTFQMGEKGIAEPVHTVTLSDFEIGKYPVTQRLWKEIMGVNPSHFKGDDLPVEQVNWDDIQEFLKKINAKFPYNFRLPTEAEWEYAARGGRLSKGYAYAGSNNLDEVGWYWLNSGDKPLTGEWDYDKMIKNNCRTHPIGLKKGNELGIHDMSGNVWEWCNDWYDDYTSTSHTNPYGPASGSNRVSRGGSWLYTPDHARVAYRNYWRPDYRNNDLGFRLARTI